METEIMEYKNYISSYMESIEPNNYINKCNCEYIISPEGFKVCKKCGEFIIGNNYILDEYLKDSRRKMIYKRIYHLNEQISNIQAKISVNPNIINIIKKNLIDDNVHKTLKELKMTNMYEKINYIEGVIHNKQYPTINEDTKRKIIILFLNIEKEYNKINRNLINKRKRFLLIRFVLYKIFLNIGLNENYINLINRKYFNDKNNIWDTIKNNLNLRY